MLVHVHHQIDLHQLAVVYRYAQQLNMVILLHGNVHQCVLHHTGAYKVIIENVYQCVHQIHGLEQQHVLV